MPRQLVHGGQHGCTVACCVVLKCRSIRYFISGLGWRGQECRQSDIASYQQQRCTIGLRTLGEVVPIHLRTRQRHEDLPGRDHSRIEFHGSGDHRVRIHSINERAASDGGDIPNAEFNHVSSSCHFRPRLRARLH